MWSGRAQVDERGRCPAVSDKVETLEDWNLRRFRHAVLDTAGLKRLKPPEQLVKDCLQLDSLAEIYGKPGIGKTHVAVSIGASVATGQTWMGHEVIPGKVVYVIAENASGTGQRIEAWEDYHRTAVPAGAITWLPLAVNLSQPAEVDAFTTIVTEIEPVLVVFDTRARCTVGVEENSAKDLGLIVAALDELRRKTKACVLTVHHPTAGGEKSRGSGAFLGAIDSELKLEAAGEGGMRLVVKKQRNAPDGTVATMRLEPFDRTVVVVQSDPVKVEGSWDELMVAELAQLCRGGEVASRADWRRAVDEACETAGRDAPSDASFKRAVARLVEDRTVSKPSRGRYAPGESADVVDLDSHRST